MLQNRRSSDFSNSMEDLGVFAAIRTQLGKLEATLNGLVLTVNRLSALAPAPERLITVDCPDNTAKGRCLVDALKTLENPTRVVVVVKDRSITNLVAQILQRENYRAEVLGRCFGCMPIEKLVHDFESGAIQIVVTTYDNIVPGNSQVVVTPYDNSFLRNQQVVVMWDYLDIRRYEASRTLALASWTFFGPEDRLGARALCSHLTEKGHFVPKEFIAFATGNTSTANQPPYSLNAAHKMTRNS